MGRARAIPAGLLVGIVLARRAFVAALAVGVLVLLGSSVPARAGTAEVRTETLADDQGPVVVPYLSFSAAPGERNFLKTDASYSPPAGAPYSGPALTLTDQVPIAAGPGCQPVSADSRAVRCVLAGFSNRQEAALDRAFRASLRIDLGDQDDRVINNAGLGTDLGASLAGGSGNDLIENTSLDYIEARGDEGNDRISLSGSEDSCGAVGGGEIDEGTTANGSDTFVASDVVTVDYGRRTENLALSSDGNANDGAANERDNIGKGTDTVIAGSGNDELRGGKEGDRLFGGTGSDTLIGGPGNDTLTSAAARASDRTAGNRLDGQAGNDRLTGSSGADRLTGGSGSDTLRGGGGSDRLDGRDGQPDSLDCGLGADRAAADARDFTFLGRRACETTRRGTRATAVELGGDTSPQATLDVGDQHGIRIVVACPADARSRCRGRVFVPGHAGPLTRAKRFSIAPGRTRPITLEPTRTLFRRITNIKGTGTVVRPRISTRRSKRVITLALAPRRIYEVIEDDGNPCP